MNFEKLRRLLPYTSLLVVIALAYAGWTLWSRREYAAGLQRQARDEEIKRAAEVVRETGGGELKILSFYASGHLVCYGVANAKTVRMEPHVDDLKPSLSRCLEVHPTKETEYKLVAEDGAGHRAEQTLVLRP